MDGDEPQGSGAPAGPSDAATRPADDPVPQDGDWVLTTVVDGTGPVELDFDLGRKAAAGGVPPPDPPAAPAEPAADVRSPAVEGLADALTGLRQAVRQEFERCAGVLFSHDRALGELNDRLVALVGRLDEMELRAATMPAAQAAAPPPVEAAPRSPELYDQALSHILEQVEGLDRRLQALDPVEVSPRVAAIEGRLAALEPLPAVVQALRTVVREGEDALAVEVSARQNTNGTESAGADAVEQLAARLSALEARLAPLEAVPDDVAVLGRIVRRDLDAVTADVQTRDQVLRRALQKEIERLQAAAGDRAEAVRATTQALELLERRVRGAAQANDDAAAATTRRLEALESRLVSVDALADDIDTLRSAARRELERLRASTQSHDQSLAETGKRFADLDGRLSRLDTLPSEVQVLRSAIRQEGDRAAAGLRSVEERAGDASDKAFRQLRQLADAVTDANERIGNLAVEVQAAMQAVQAVHAVQAMPAPEVPEVAPAETPGAVDDNGPPSDPDAPAPAPSPAG